MNTITIGTDCKTLGKDEVKTMSPEEKNKLMELVKQGWDTFHRYGLWLSIACCIGIYVGISISRVYFHNKIKESIAVGGMLVDKDVYSIIKK